ncbi:hypothetical protein cypCar_00044158 [Cyprinus carpio]|nr:hypothetical protein cypCar_00044158 [Cyprinus carpio]
MALLFSDEEFQQAWSELDAPQLDGGWEFFTETGDVKIYRLYNKDTGLYEYKVFGSLASCAPDLCADVYMDLNYRRQWDSYVKVPPVAGGQMHSDMQYVYVRERRDLDVGGRKIWVVLAKSWSVPHCPEKKGVIRVEDYKQSLALESDGSGSTKVFMNYFDNPGGMIQTWLVNWAAKTGVPAFLTDMKKACSNYSSYCKNNK